MLFYSTGKPCKRKHANFARYVSCGNCVECKRLATAAWAKDNPEKSRASVRKYIKNNPKKYAASKQKYKINNREKEAAYARKWAKDNPEKNTANTVAYYMRKFKAMPVWADSFAIVEIYALAAKLGKHVDHILPLKGKLVCGLHVENNLQLLTPAENLSKNNRYEIAA